MANVKVQVLVAAMHQNDHSLPEKMHIQTDAIIGNQCDRNAIEQYEFCGRVIQYLNFSERGVGLNRNNALLRASGEYCLFSDEDMVYVDGYEEIVETAFRCLPDADAIIFNISTNGSAVHRRHIKKIKRLHFYNAFNYGAARIAVRLKSIKRENISFHTCFGGGTRFSSGEDTLFIADMLRKKLKVYAYPANIGVVDQTSSTWFRGYDKKYLYDKGALFAALSRPFARSLCIQDLIRHPYIYKEQGLSLLRGYGIMKRGIKAFQELKPYAPNDEDKD